MARKRPAETALATARKLYDLGYDIHWIKAAVLGNKKTGKAPIGENKGAWGRTERYGWAELEKKYREGLNLGFQPGTTSGGIFVIDFDWTNEEDKAEGRALLRNWLGDLEPTAYSGGGGEHYHLKSSKDIPNVVLWKGKNAHNEIRIIADGGNCVLPPSIHWQGGTYRWGTREVTKASRKLLSAIESVRPVDHGDADIEVGKPVSLKGLPRELVDLIREEGQEGSRSERLYQVIAKLHRRQVRPENILATIMHKEWGCSSKPVAQGLRWAKTEVARVVAKVTEEDKVKQEVLAKTIEEMNEQFFIVGLGSSVRIGRFHKGNLLTLSQRDFDLLYAGQVVDVEDKQVPLAKIWLNNTGKEVFQTVVFAPGEEVDPETLNLWSGFDLEPSAKGTCDRFLEYMREIVCAGDESNFKWLWNWCAHLFQNPNEKPGTVPVLRGPTGTGKSFFTDALRTIIGKRHSLKISQRNQLVGRFNSHLANKLLVVAEEVTWGGNREMEATLRDFVTAPQLPVEGKGLDLYEVDSYHRLVIISNERWVVHAQDNERRYVILDISPARQKDLKYFRALDQELTHGGYERLMYLLMQHPVNREMALTRHDTAGAHEQQIHSLSPIDRWWFEVLDRGEIIKGQGWPRTIESSKLAAAFRMKYPKAAEYELTHTFIKSLRERTSAAGLVLSRRRVHGSVHRMVLFRDLAFTRDAFAKSLGWNGFDDMVD